MQAAIWKFLALIGVIGIGCLVVYQVHSRIPRAQQHIVSPGDFQPVDGEGDSTESPTPDPDPFLQLEPTPTLAEQHPEPPQQPTADAPPAQADWSLLDFGAAAPEIAGTPTPDEDADPELDPERDIVSSPSDPATGDDTTASPDAVTPVEFEHETAAAPDQATPAAADWSFFMDGGERDGESVVDGPDEAPATSADPFAESGALPTEEPGPTPTAASEGPPPEPTLVPDESSEGDRSVVDPATAGPEIGTAPPVTDWASEFEPLGEANPAGIGIDDDAAADPFAAFPTGEPGADEPESASQRPDPATAEFGAATTPPSLPAVDADPFSFEPLPDDESTAETAEAADEPPLGHATAEGFGSAPAEFGGGENSVPLTVQDTDPPQPELVMPERDTAPGVGAEPQPQSLPLFSDSEPLGPAAGPAAAVDVREDRPRAASPQFVGDGVIDAGAPSGRQQPELQVEKVAPSEAVVGEPLVYSIHVKNVGRSAAYGVIVEDRIPRGTTLEGTIPQAELVDKQLIWRMGTLEPGREETIRIKVVPTEPGDIGSVATVRFAAEIAASTNITTADLSLEMSGPEEAVLGEPVVIRYHVTNSGNGPARDAYLRCLLPAAFEHPGGNDIEYALGDLPPGGSKEVELTVRAAAAGAHTSRTLLSTGARTHTESELTVNILPSRLHITREGPARRFVGRPAEYVTVVSNRSGRTLTDVTVIEELPDALEPAAVPEDGRYEPEERTITWTIPRLPAGASYEIRSSVVPRLDGFHSSVITARDAAGNEARLASELEAAGFSSLQVDWETDGGPVAVGEQIVLRLTLRNRGTAAAENVQALFELPPNTRFVSADGPATFEQEGRVVRFADLEAIDVNGAETFDIILTADAPGSTRVSAHVTTADHAEPLRHDEPLLILGGE